MNPELIILVVFLLALLFGAIILFLNRTKKHWIKNRSGEGLPGLAIIIRETEDTTFNKLKTGADGGFNFDFRVGEASISIVEPNLGIREIVDHPETTVDNHGDATFKVKNTNESLVFIVAPIGRRRKKSNKSSKTRSPHSRG
ncbi:MAG: hypothetical protein WCG99_04220 [Candidatus Berkelbacteria bacterium]